MKEKRNRLWMTNPVTIGKKSHDDYNIENLEIIKLVVQKLVEECIEFVDSKVMLSYEDHTIVPFQKHKVNKF